MNTHKSYFILEAGEYYTSLSGACWWIAAGSEQDCAIALSRETQEENIILSPSGSGVLGLEAMTITVNSGSLTVFPADLIALARMQAYIDSALKMETKLQTRRYFGFSQCKHKKLPAANFFESWLVERNIFHDDGSNNIISILRSTEWYWLVSYLLGVERQGGKGVKGLGAGYGISGSHFRRLAKRALGNTTKEEMCRWRLTRALFNLLETNESITDIALNNGYSSTSHFSTDFKNAIGFPPRELRKILDYEF